MELRRSVVCRPRASTGSLAGIALTGHPHDRRFLLLRSRNGRSTLRLIELLASADVASFDLNIPSALSRLSLTQGD